MDMKKGFIKIGYRTGARDSATFLGVDIRRMGIHIVAAKGSGKSFTLGRDVVWGDFKDEVPTIVIDPANRNGVIDYFLDRVCYELGKTDNSNILDRVAYVDLSGYDEHVCPMPLFFQYKDNEELHAISNR